MARTKLIARAESAKKRYPLARISQKYPRAVKKFKPSVQGETTVSSSEADEETSEAGASSYESGVSKNQAVTVAEPVIPSQVTSHNWVYYLSSALDSLFVEGLTDQMKGLPEYAGKWLLFNDVEETCDSVGMSHHDYAWEIVKSLVKDSKDSGIIAAKCSTAANESDFFSDANTSQGVVCCYTSNFRDKQSVKKAAEAIRKAYPYPSCMYYKAEKEYLSRVNNQYGDRLVTMYKHTVDSKFFERGVSNDFRWQLVDFVKDIALNENTMPSRVTSHKWLYVLSTSYYKGRNSFGASDSMVDVPETAGKWLLFQSSNGVCPLEGMSHHDYAWKVIKTLVEDFSSSNIIAIKCSTNGKYSYTSGKGVICCYTQDYNDKASVKKAADAIRKAYRYPNPMFYKTEEDSDSGLYSSHGDQSFTIYKHLPGNEMFERTTEGSREWKLVKF